MEISRKRVLQRHLEPARPLRRCNIQQDEQFEWPETIVNICAQVPVGLKHKEINIEVEQLYQIANMHKKKQGRISYTRKFLIGFARCSVAMRKPEFLPDHPVVLPKARDPELLRLYDEQLD